ncbi:MAG: hypothetical protein LBH06_06770 [Rikenellaceae bacterium]|jgi:hypothetical protein|nr:hypothetical protein [Rikenellaceae bacterium]
MQPDYQFTIHYFLDNDTHTMDAIIHNELEKQLLKAIQSLQLLFDNKITVKVQAKKEGGLQDNYELIIAAAATTGALIQGINAFIKYFFRQTFTNQRKQRITPKK